MASYFIIFIPAAYLIGAFPTSAILSRLIYGIDLRTKGSGNLGATNVFRVLGAWPGVLVLAIDIFKGFAPVYWIPALMAAQGGGTAEFKVTLGLAAVAGHIFSPFVQFRGGKGVATAAGVFLAICPWALMLSLAVWLAAMAAFRIVSVASLAAAVGLPVFVCLTADRALSGYGVIQGFSILIALAVILTHMSNIRRLLQGEEKKLGTRSKEEGR
ncbi:MAG: glycerol-3-phosphate 1-O-acyltransferase PlsY [Gemmatimonadota bacterium]|nr:glycerol-3-phosphate 1-O-acyltransferase PlsY [Gemmatimonadota bacterium]